MTKTWAEFYPPGVPLDITLSGETIVDMFMNSCQLHADRVAYYNLGSTLTYAEVEKHSRALAAYFQQDLGLVKGDRVAIMMPNLMQYPIAVFAALRAGLVVVNVNPLYTTREFAHLIHETGSKAVVVLSNFANIVQTALPKTPELEHVIVTNIGDMFSFPKATMVNFVVKYVKKMVPAWAIPGAINFMQALKQGAKHTFKPVDLTLDDVAFLQSTSGTTGVAKAATLLHRNMMANVEQMFAWICDTFKNGDTMVTALPLYHIFALTINCLLVVKYGGKNILITNPRDIPGFVKELKQHKFAAMSGVNTLYNALLNNEDFKDIDFNAFRLAISGGMPLQKDVVNRWHDATGHWIIEGYGLSECSPVVTVNPFTLNAFSPSIGMPLPSTDVEIRDDHGNPLPMGEAGEICVRGPQVMPGYWQRPDETAKTFYPDNWFRTGDIGVMDDKGWFAIVDRKKNMVVVSGFNVYPSEVEEVISGMPEVMEVAVIGVPDERSTEAVKAFVVKKDPSLTKQQIIDFCSDKLTRYKIPKQVEFRDDLPKNPVGKILHKDLREE
tara:strand:- start:7681 stop:9339 length:1659 start_codon:yes stop_codon:yes gene_type:complete